MLLTPAEVLSVDLDYKSNYIYSITFKFLDQQSNSDTSTNSARPLHTFIKHIPVPGEIVSIVQSATTSSGGNNKLSSLGWYYLPSTSIRSNITYNGLDTASSISNDKPLSYEDSILGQTSKSIGTKVRSKQGFNYNYISSPIRPYIGDTIIEGRNGGSIRLSSTHAPNQLWMSSGTTPGTIVSLRNSKTINDSWANESLEKDSHIILSSNALLNVVISSKSTTSIAKYGAITPVYTSDQIYLNSDRIILNSKSKELVLSSASTIYLTSTKNLILESNSINLESVSINLTKTPIYSAVLGEQLILILQQIINLANPALTAPGVLSPVLVQLQSLLSKNVRLS